jgi:hypothetical protein
MSELPATTGGVDFDALDMVARRLVTQAPYYLPEALRPEPLKHVKIGTPEHEIALAENIDAAVGRTFVVLMAGAEVGLPPMTTLQQVYSPSPGKVGFQYPALVALLRRNKYVMEWTKSTPSEATLKLTAPDGSVHTETWNKARAVSYQIYFKGGKIPLWSKWEKCGQETQTMLKARCVSSACRAFAAEVSTFAYTPDEIDEILEKEHLVPADAKVIESESMDPAARTAALLDAKKAEAEKKESGAYPLVLAAAVDIAMDVLQSPATEDKNALEDVENALRACHDLDELKATAATLGAEIKKRSEEFRVSCRKMLGERDAALRQPKPDPEPEGDF